MKTFGIMVEKFDISQQSLLIISQLNSLLAKHHDVSPIVFHQDYGPFAEHPQFSTMLEIEAWDFDGTLISTDLSTTKTILACPRAPKKLFYVWDLEWLYLQKASFEQMSVIYQHDDIQLIARSDSHYDIIKKCWKTL